MNDMNSFMLTAWKRIVIMQPCIGKHCTCISLEDWENGATSH
jgi:hypothetical protein